MGVVSNIVVLSIVFVGGVLVFRKYQQAQTQPTNPATPAPGGCGGAHTRSSYENCYCSGGSMYCSRNGSSCMMASCNDEDLDCCSTTSTEDETKKTTCNTTEQEACRNMQNAYGTNFECKLNNNCVCSCIPRSNYAKSYATVRHGRPVVDMRPRRDKVMYELVSKPIPTKIHKTSLEDIKKFRNNPAISISYTDPPDVNVNNDLYEEMFSGYEYNGSKELPIRMNIFSGMTLKGLTGTTSEEQDNLHSHNVNDNKLNMLWFGRTQSNSIYRNMMPSIR